jgi:hypothetical protein
VVRGEARRRERKEAQVNVSGHSDVCVCVTAKPQGLRRRCVQGVILGHPVRPARAGHLGVGGLLPEGDARPKGAGPPGEVFYHLSGPVRGPSAALRPS